MRLYFARHGESEANILKEFSNRPGKHGLTDKGKRQAGVDHSFSLVGHIDYATYIVAELRGRKWVCLRWGDEMFET